jgi:uncharacterized membrane protein (UPF0127 family)
MRVFTSRLGISAIELKVTESVLERMRGLLGSSLVFGQGLLLRPCNMVHTFGMRYAIDVVFVSRRGLVMKIYSKVPARRICLCIGAYAVIELPAGDSEARQLYSGALVPANWFLS